MDLPNIPPSPLLRRLTVESNVFIDTFIQRALDEEGLDSSWTASIKNALGDLGECIVSGQWILGLWKTRKAQNDTQALEGKVARERTRKDRERSNESKASKVKQNDKSENKEVEITVSQTKEEQQSIALKEIHALTRTSTYSTPAPGLSSNHLFLTVSFHRTEAPDREFDFDFIPASKQCAFLQDTYSFPFFEDGKGRHGDGGHILCGLDTWNLGEKKKPHIVGGNFVFRNLTSATAHESLITVLKVSTYTYLSLILEQSLLSNSHVTLQFPPAILPRTTATPPPTPVTASPTPSPSKRRTRSNKSSSGIWSFISKKTESIFHRSAANLDVSDDPPPRASSLDLGSVFSSSNSSRRASDVAVSTSQVNTIRGTPAENEDQRVGPFTSALQGIRSTRCILSTSPGVDFPPPPLLSRLAAREQRLVSTSESSSLASSMQGSDSTLSAATTVLAPLHSSGLRLTGVERAGLASMMGWEGREARGKGMSGLRSFVRHQGLTVLHAEHTAPDVPCGRPRWVTFRYWARSFVDETEVDRTLGEMVEHTCETAEEPCEKDGCDKPRGRHTVSWTCSGTRIGVDVGTMDNVGGDGNIMMWESCRVCNESSDRVCMDDGTYLFSFAKYLELLLWSPHFASLSLCEHTKQLGSSLMETRFRIQRHFAYRGHVLTFGLTSIHNKLFEVRVPNLQLLSGSNAKEERQLEEVRRKRDGEEEREVLYTEMDEWWKEFKTRLDRLDAFLRQEVEAMLEGKDLPPLPTSDDDDLDEELSRSWLSDKIQTPSPQRPQAGRSTSFVSQMISRPNTPRGKPNKPAAPYPPGLSFSIHQSRQLLVQLRLSFQKTEDAVRKEATETPQLSLNDVRRTFRSTARGAVKRLAAWQKKHAPGAPADIGSDLEPEWWHATCHAVPGGRVVVREGEWGSVIAFTLSSLDYQRELISLNTGAALQPSSAIPTTTPSEQASPNPVATIKTLKSFAQPPDPDDTEATSFWDESEAYTAVITRREHPRDVSSLLSLREVLRTKKSFEGSTLGSRFSGPLSRGVAPPSAWAQPQVQVNLHSADGQVSQFPDAAEEVERVLGSQYPSQHQVEATFSSDDIVTPTPSSFIERNIRSGQTASILSLDEPEWSEPHVQPAAGGPPTGLPLTSPTPTTGHNLEPGSAASASSFSSAISSAMRYLLSTGSPTPSRPSSPLPTHHGLLALDPTHIDDRPHIKYEWTIGKRLKFSCTVYYAKQFDALRKRCGVGDIMLKSLERTENWAAVGGKSKSNFWKSSDDRFIIKTLVNAWNVADLQVLIDLGPAYFRYIDSTVSKPSVLAKLMGFYTVEIKNLETGTVQAKADLLVMENLFYKQKVAKTFDLKGIQSRRVKLNGEAEQRTLFDGEWIEAQQRSPLLIQPHSKLILQEAIKSDADFLAKSNIMDYSLLLGIDEERHEIACGLVDTIGSYTFAKTLEYKAKQNLNSGKNKDVTVMPPAEYQSRFVNAIEGYFMACPDKWTKPPRYIDRTLPSDLASVL